MASSLSLLLQQKRVGRGIGSGLGKTSGRGHKGQKARTGASRPAVVAPVWGDGAPQPASMMPFAFQRTHSCRWNPRIDETCPVDARVKPVDGCHRLLMAATACPLPPLPAAGRSPRLGFEGGQTPMRLRVPLRGFHNPHTRFYR